MDRAKLAKIHIAKKELGLTDEAYRDILRLHFQAESAKSLDDRQGTVLLNLFKAKGWAPKQAATKASLPGRSIPADGQSKKVQALWITLHRAGVVRDGSDRALLSFVRRITGRDRLQWCDAEQKGRVIEALKAMGDREKASRGQN